MSLRAVCQQSWTKSVENFVVFYPQNALPAGLVPLWPLPSPHPGQCCSVRVNNNPTGLQHCFLRGEGRRGGFVVASALKSFTLTLQFIWQRLFFWTFFTKTVARKTCCTHSYISRHLFSSLLINKYSKISHKERHVLLTVCLEYYISQWSRCFACSLREKTNCAHEVLLNDLVHGQDKFSAKLLKKISLNVHILNAPFSQVVFSKILEIRNV